MSCVPSYTQVYIKEHQIVLQYPWVPIVREPAIGPLPNEVPGIFREGSRQAHLGAECGLAISLLPCHYHRPPICDYTQCIHAIAIGYQSPSRWKQSH